MTLTPSDAIEIRRARGKGRGVFARRPIRKGEVIERVPMLVFPAAEHEKLTVLSNYCFARGAGTVALALGFGSLYNHSYRPNARYDDVGPRTKQFTALRRIEPGEEITINYHGEPGCRKAAWFEVVEEPRSKPRDGPRHGKG